MSSLAKKLLKGGAELFGAALAGGPVGVGVKALQMLGEGLGLPADEDTIEAHLDAHPEDMVRVRQIEADREVELARIAAQVTAEENETLREDLRQRGETNRTELDSADQYVRRTRPKVVRTIIYTLASQVWLTMLAVIGTGLVGLGAVADGGITPAEVLDVAALMKAVGGAIAEAMAYTSGSMTLAVGVVGVHVRSRSTHDKPIAAGKEPPKGLLTGAAEWLSSKK